MWSFKWKALSLRFSKPPLVKNTFVSTKEIKERLYSQVGGFETGRGVKLCNTFLSLGYKDLISISCVKKVQEIHVATF